ncbi:hypothetical protein KM043_003197 [Ampulex compressa]|nr:hypothetical protein KM043_003197 [Ampulex compressa]
MVAGNFAIGDAGGRSLANIDVAPVIRALLPPSDAESSRISSNLPPWNLYPDLHESTRSHAAPSPLFLRPAGPGEARKESWRDSVAMAGQDCDSLPDDLASRLPALDKQP